MCAPCAMAFNSKMRAARQVAREGGRCPHCKRRKLKPGACLCSKCLKLKAAAARARRRRWRAEALCSSCGGEIEHSREGRRTCGACGRK